MNYCATGVLKASIFLVKNINTSIASNSLLEVFKSQAHITIAGKDK